MKVANLAENDIDEAGPARPGGGERNRAAVDELMSRQMDVIVCHPSRGSAAGRRDSPFDGGPPEPPIVILTESAGAGAALPVGAPGRLSHSDASRTAPAAAHSPGADDLATGDRPGADHLAGAAGGAGAGDRAGAGANSVGAVADCNAAASAARTSSAPQVGAGRLWHDMAVSLAQEIRAPLTLIGEYCSLVRDGLAGAVSAEQAAYLAIVSGEVDDVAATIQSVSRLADLERGAARAAPAAHRPQEAIARLSPALARKTALRGITLAAAVPDDLPEVYCDLELLDCAMTLLANEVIKAAPAGATLQIDARSHAASSEVVVGVYLADDPIDPPRRSTPREGEPPAAALPGEALRLSMARELVQRNLGALRARTCGGAGFEFTLPLADPEVVVARHIQARRRHLTSPRWVYLLTIDLDGAGETGAGAAVEGAIHDILRGEHLLFRLDGDRWLLVVEREQSDQRILLEEFRQGWAERRRHHRASAGQSQPRRLPLVRPTLNAMYQILPDKMELAQPAAAPPPAAEVERPAAPDIARKPRILVVDDEPNLVQALRLRLTLSGFDVLTAADGQAGLATAIASRPQLVVLDIRMPKLDGLTVLDRLREHDHTKAIPVIIVSASHIDRRSALQRGARYFLEKPYDSQVLMTTIKTALERSALGGGL